MSEYLGSIKKLDKLGRIVIPKEIRAYLGLDVGTPVELVVNKKSKEIAIKKMGENNEQSL